MSFMRGAVHAFNPLFQPSNGPEDGAVSRDDADISYGRDILRPATPHSRRQVVSEAPSRWEGSAATRGSKPRTIGEVKRVGTNKTGHISIHCLPWRTFHVASQLPNYKQNGDLHNDERYWEVMTNCADVEEMLAYAWHRKRDQCHHEILAMLDALDRVQQLITDLYA